jgi:hypothetical protein
MPAQTLDSRTIAVVVCIPRIRCAGSEGPTVTASTPASAGALVARVATDLDCPHLVERRTNARSDDDAWANSEVHFPS